MWSMYMKHVSENVMMKLIMLYFEYVPFCNSESADRSTGIQDQANRMTDLTVFP